jgi:hypothetical protein
MDCLLGIHWTELEPRRDGLLVALGLGQEVTRRHCHGPSAGCSCIRFRQTEKETEKSRKEASKDRWARMDYMIGQSEAL